MKFCSSCGSQIHENAVICVNCGASQTSSVVSDKKFCSICGNECIKDAVICVNCGTPFSTPTATKKPHKPVSPAKIVSVIAIILVALGTLSIFISILTLLTNSASFSPIDLLLSAAVSIFTLVGFIKQKNNILPGLGYMLSAVLTLISFVINIVDYEYFSIANLVSVVQVVLLAMLFINKKPNGRKYWYLPVALAGIAVIISTIENIANGAFEYQGYYSTSFMWDAFIPYIASQIGSVVGICVSALNAKLNWFADAEPVQEINPNPVFVPEQHIAEVTIQESAQETEI